MTNKYINHSRYRRKYLKARRVIKSIATLTPEKMNPQDQYSSLVEMLTKIKQIALEF